jgi:hypothetical protein
VAAQLLSALDVAAAFRYAFVLAAGLSLAVPPLAEAGDKIDRALRDALNAGAATQSVIISVNPGCHAGIQAIEQHGDVAALAQSPCVKAVSSDAPVRAVGTTFDSTSAVLDASASLRTTTAANLLWGENVLWGALNASNVLWGDVSGSTLLWGDTILWGDNMVWGETLEAVF